MHADMRLLTVKVFSSEIVLVSAHPWTMVQSLAESFLLNKAWLTLYMSVVIIAQPTCCMRSLSSYKMVLNELGFIQLAGRINNRTQSREVQLFFKFVTFQSFNVHVWTHHASHDGHGSTFSLPFAFHRVSSHAHAIAAFGASSLVESKSSCVHCATSYCCLTRH